MLFEEDIDTIFGRNLRNQETYNAKTDDASIHVTVSFLILIALKKQIIGVLTTDPSFLTE